MWRKNPLRRAVQAFSGYREGEVPSSWWSAWQRCATGQAQRQLEGQPVQPGSHSGAETAGLASVLGQEGEEHRPNRDS